MTETTESTGGATAPTKEKDLLTRLAEVGEDAMQKIGELPGGQRFLEAANTLRDRVDDLATRVRALDPLERRVTELERRLAELEGGHGPREPDDETPGSPTAAAG